MSQLLDALSKVIDPELRRSITELGMVERAELTSTETKASVWSITIAPPLGRLTERENALSI